MRSSPLPMSHASASDDIVTPLRFAISSSGGLNGADVRLEVRARKRGTLPPVAGGQVARLADLAGQQPATERRVRDERDAERTRDREQVTTAADRAA